MASAVPIVTVQDTSNVLGYNAGVYDTSASVPAESTSILGNLGSVIQGISNVGLQWYQGVTKGVSGQLAVPQPTQATGSQTLASILPSGVNFVGLIILAIIAVVAIKFLKRR